MNDQINEQEVLELEQIENIEELEGRIEHEVYGEIGCDTSF